MKRIDAIGLMAVAVLCSACGTGFSKAHGRTAQIVDYVTRTVCDAEVHVTKDASYDSDGVVVTLPSETPVKIIDVQQAGEEERNNLDYSLVKVTVTAEVDHTEYAGWVYISGLFFDGSVLENILKDTMKREPYAAYIVEHVDGIDQALGLRLMARMCESARVERDPDQRTYLFYLARTYLFGIADFNLASCDTPPLNLAARYDDVEFLADIYSWCAENDIPIDSPAGVNANTALIEAAIVGNPKCVEYLIRNGADVNYKNTKGKAAEDYMLASSTVALRNIAAYSRNVDDYGNALESLFSEEMRAVPDTACLDVPASVYIRFKKSGISMHTTDYDEFLNEISVQELAGRDGQSGFSPEVYPFDGYVHTDDGSRLNLREGPSAKGKILGAVNDGTSVQILSRDDNPDDIDDIIDYWYKIRDGNVEGWCFGGYLSRKIPIEESSLRFERGYGEQLPLDQGDTAYALADCSLRASRDETVAVRAYDSLEVLDACAPLYVSFGDSSIYQYYLVKDANNACGIVSGKYLANERMVPDEEENLEFFLVPTRTDGHIVTTRIFMRDIERKQCKEIDFLAGDADVPMNDRFCFLNVRIDRIDACEYTLRDRDLAFVEFTCEYQWDEGGLNQVKAFFNIEDFTAHYATSVNYSEFQNYDSVDAFSRVSTSWDPDDPSEISILQYGRYYEEEDSATEYSYTQTYTRDANDIFKYELSNEEQSDELPDK